MKQVLPIPEDTDYIRVRYDKLMSENVPVEFVQAEFAGRNLSATRIEIMFALLEDYKRKLKGESDAK